MPKRKKRVLKAVKIGGIDKTRPVKKIGAGVNRPTENEVIKPESKRALEATRKERLPKNDFGAFLAGISLKDQPQRPTRRENSRIGIWGRRVPLSNWEIEGNSAYVRNFNPLTEIREKSDGHDFVTDEERAERERARVANLIAEARGDSIHKTPTIIRGWGQEYKPMPFEAEDDNVGLDDSEEKRQRMKRPAAAARSSGADFAKALAGLSLK